jgi:hypothetical protein
MKLTVTDKFKKKKHIITHILLVMSEGHVILTLGSICPRMDNNFEINRKNNLSILKLCVLIFTMACVCATLHEKIYMFVSLVKEIKFGDLNKQQI